MLGWVTYVLSVCVLLAHAHAAVADPYRVTTGTAVYSFTRTYSVGPLPECSAVFDVLSAGQLFNCDQSLSKEGGTASIAVSGSALVATVVNGGHGLWECKNKRATKSAIIMGVIPWDTAAGPYDDGNRMYFSVGMAAWCITLEQALFVADGPQRRMLAEPNHNKAAAVPFLSTWGGATSSFRRSVSSGPISQCQGLFSYLQTHQVMTCGRAGSSRAYFVSSNSTLGVSVNEERGTDLDCVNQIGGNKVVLTATIIREIFGGAYGNDVNRFRAGLAAACIMLDPSLRR